MRSYIAIAAVCVMFSSVIPARCEEQAEDQNRDYTEFNYGQVAEGSEDWVQAIRVTQPELRSDVSGIVTVTFNAESMTEATAFCWQQSAASNADNRWGRDVNLTPDGIVLDKRGNGWFKFNAEEFPNGPMTVRIYARNEAGRKDIFELQLFNTGGVVWEQGIPDNAPPAASSMQLVFEDDFDRTLSISNDGRDTTYASHKPGGGDFSGWQFSDVLGEGKPFSRKGTWLRIAARKDEESPKGRSGIIASVDMDFDGIWAKAPCYFECRFTAQSAIGTWPAFWTLALGDGSDELDIVEAYGGKGKGNPNHPGYSIVSHFWNQKNPDGSKKKGYSTRADIMNLGGKSYWSTTFHTYGVYVGLEETVYYFDDIEVLRHPSGEISKTSPHFFLINLAIGGISGWPIDLERYENGSDMWIDYVRVFAEEPVDPDYTPALGPKPQLASAGVGLNFQVKDDRTTRLKAGVTAGHDAVSQRNWNNLIGHAGEVASLNDSNGESVPEMKAVWKVPGGNDQAWRSRKAREWGFQHGNLALQSGFIQLGGTLDISGIPYQNYDLYVYVGAGDNAGGGSVTLTSPQPGEVGPVKTYYYNHGWLEGKFHISDATDAARLKDGNVVVFKGNSANSVQLDWSGDLNGGWTGVTGVQVVERP
ncbi:glycoside hydrolase family 16 protein [Calycomorphotria hydatis]|uniref:Endo-1,3-1,4-beta-glycanase ExsH n=1 Tax=Calycomorphotria hydatis TaxID=2528027 RepID=A0A517TD64_9PLAN|nr:family 16 glycosylhydrolase [Calycomorphotria hydatis]QDT66314.1 Endo-1,3-1,4-beta-glycanase ExsH [Calycomorphotria hydatis]